MAGWLGGGFEAPWGEEELPDSWPETVQIDGALAPEDGDLRKAGGLVAAEGPLSAAVRSPGAHSAANGHLGWDRGKLLPAPPPSPESWRDPRVGWGLVLPEREGMSPEELARADDAPEPVRELLACRPGSPVLRYRPRFGPAERLLFLRDWRHRTDIPLDRSPKGTAAGRLPYYLLIAASPEEVPWSMQYVLNAGSCVGRLHFDGPEADLRLGRYVEHLLGPWDSPATAAPSQAGARFDRPLAWAVDRRARDPRPPDITRLLRRAIAAPLYEKWAKDEHLSPILLDGRRGEATVGRLAETLAEHRPGVVIATGHGRTGPLGDDAAMAARLGLPVDQDDADVDPARLLRDWRPSGAVWVSWGCATAGSSAESLHADLFEPDSVAGRILRGVAGLGDRVAPLPQALLGADEPSRAFVGQVEPTFDWTLRQPRSRALLSEPLVEGLYERLFYSAPIGLCLAGWFESLARLYLSRDRLEAQLDPTGSGSEQAALRRALFYLALAARDVQSTVLLGDPTVALPPLTRA